MKLAIKEALKSVEAELEKIKQTVQDKATEVASRTLAKLREMDPNLAGQLSPHFKAEPKWDGLFKMALTGDNEIPINKRGSGVRRLVLINFFRAEAVSGRISHRLRRRASLTDAKSTVSDTLIVLLTLTSNPLGFSCFSRRPRACS